ncbi:Uncharacterized membrane protein YdjX, TVP38/TMEM64 family, SNARE-associated domain [Anaerovirgula multivorans]|uniref:TVP38/TMEM64 family membrane protein n=1 Tax=Anaerovirgula multivorans TaxID=312168 RepID=A0A239EQS1_9FIRM|nr:TVP38/TMEM64 family protein [Anaerovirgula multivorans]SNS46373.1 Uncharacterized membrane protein YdjX, TVP38/TMEM64 family, SNARE-associated domain [Anaerovirgula multivorans]
MKRKKIFTTVTLIITGILILLWFFYYRKNSSIQWDIETLQQTVEGFGIWGLLVFIGIAAIRPFLLFPNILIFIVGGLIYGTLLGSLAALIGAMLAFSLCYWLGGRFQQVFRKTVGEKNLIKLQNLQDKEIIRTLFIMRVTPAFPIDPISYGSGLAGMPFEKFFLGSLLGITPKIFLYTFLGDTIDNVFSIRTLVVYLLLSILAILPVVLQKKEI